MFCKLFVVVALVAVASAAPKPGYLGGAAIAAPIAPTANAAPIAAAPALAYGGLGLRTGYDYGAPALAYGAGLGYSSGIGYDVGLGDNAGLGYNAGLDYSAGLGYSAELGYSAGLGYSELARGGLISGCADSARRND